MRGAEVRTGHPLRRIRPTWHDPAHRGVRSFIPRQRGCGTIGSHGRDEAKGANPVTAADWQAIAEWVTAATVLTERVRQEEDGWPDQGDDPGGRRTSHGTGASHLCLLERKHEVEEAIYGTGLPG